MIERHWNADLLAKIFGFVFILVGIAGFIPNPLVSESGVFRVNEAHNLIHIVTGVLFFAAAFMDASVRAIRGIAVLYAIVAILGFVFPDNMLFGIVAMNMADRWLHAALAAVLLLVGFVTPAHEPMRQAHQ
jgi:hypothetical protein